HLVGKRQRPKFRSDLIRAILQVASLLTLRADLSSQLVALFLLGFQALLDCCRFLSRRFNSILILEAALRSVGALLPLHQRRCSFSLGVPVILLRPLSGSNARLASQILFPTRF